MEGVVELKAQRPVLWPFRKHALHEIKSVERCSELAQHLRCAMSLCIRKWCPFESSQESANVSRGILMQSADHWRVES